MTPNFISRLLAGAAMSLPVSALAHHPMGGETPTTLMEGLLSGVGHPIIGIDHFLFLCAAGVLLASVATSSRFVSLAAIAAGTICGTGLHIVGMQLPFSEGLVAITVLLLGIVTFTTTPRSSLILTAGLFIATLFHGYAYAEAIIGAEPTPIGAYLFGLAVTSAAIVGVIAQFIAYMVQSQGQQFLRRAKTGMGWAVTLGGAVFLAMAFQVA